MCSLTRSVTRAINGRRPRPFSTTTASPSAMSRRRASARWIRSAASAAPGVPSLTWVRVRRTSPRSTDGRRHRNRNSARARTGRAVVRSQTGLDGGSTFLSSHLWETASAIRSDRSSRSPYPHTADLPARSLRTRHSDPRSQSAGRSGASRSSGARRSPVGPPPKAFL